MPKLFKSLLLLLLVVSAALHAESPGESVATQYRGLDSGLQLLKQQSLELERDLLILEEQVANPLVIYFSMDTDRKFRLDTLNVLLDGEKLVNQQFSREDLKPLRQGGAQLIYKGGIKPGKHELIAYYISDRDYQRGAKFIIEKTLQPAFLEVIIQKQESKESRLQPAMIIHEWKQR